jgi:hypothetical protein
MSTLKKHYYEYAVVAVLMSVISCVATRLILGDSGLNFSSIGLLLASALFLWRGYNEPN